MFHYKRNLYNYLVDFHELDVAYSTFRHYLLTHSEFNDYFTEKKRNKGTKAPARFETSPGEQVQIDWKEDITFITSDGEKIKINVLSVLLSYSRYPVFMVSESRNQDHLLSLLTESFEHFGGVPKVVLSDNMKTIMDEARTSKSAGKVKRRFLQFSQDFGFQTKACVSFRPSTKGKIETQMKILGEIDAY